MHAENMSLAPTRLARTLAVFLLLTAAGLTGNYLSSDNAVVSGHKAYGFAAFLNKLYAIDALRDCIDSLLA
ncbi:MAG: hypothetical protein ACM3MB_02525 [Acidobacteriota bacterium]